MVRVTSIHGIFNNDYIAHEDLVLDIETDGQQKVSVASRIKSFP